MHSVFWSFSATDHICCMAATLSGKFGTCICGLSKPICQARLRDFWLPMPRMSSPRLFLPTWRHRLPCQMMLVIPRTTSHQLLNTGLERWGFASVLNCNEVMPWVPGGKQLRCSFGYAGDSIALNLHAYDSIALRMRVTVCPIMQLIDHVQYVRQ